MQLSVVLVLLIVTISNGARILGVFNHPGASHTFLGKVLLQALAQRGHEIVMISSFPLEKPQKNYRDIALPELLEDLKFREKMYFKGGSSYKDLVNMTLSHTDYTFQHPEVKELIRKDKFDLIIMDYFYNEGTLILGHIFKAPIIYSSSFGNNILINAVTGNSLPWSYVPGFALQADDELSFKQRLTMAFVNVVLGLLQPRRLGLHDEMLKKYFKNPPSIRELEKNVALVLSNSHYSVETSRPYTANIIPVAGFHVGEPKKLPQNLQQLLDASTEGVVVFSLGSQIKSSSMGVETRDNIIKALGKLTQKVLWKYDGDDLKNLPKNIEIIKWLPQLEVLNHKNVKLFVTHGGLLSMIESIHCGVPFVCIPFNGDQHTNAAFIQSRFLGLKVSSIDDLTKGDAFYNALHEVLSNPKYTKTAKQYSNYLRDQPIKPLDHAIYWVEYVLKYNGTSHMKPFSLQLPWYIYYSLDVIATFAVVLSILLTFIYLLLKFTIRTLCKIFCTKTMTKTKVKTQ